MSTLELAPKVDMFSQFTAREFWQKSFPELSIEQLSGVDTAIPPEKEALSLMYRQFGEEGYMRGYNEALLPITQRMAPAIARCVEMGISPVFLFVFDEPWQCFYHLHPLISGVLGEKYAMLPDFWAWHVDPQKGESGWKQHRDKPDCTGLAADGTPTALTVWIPMTEATPLNGCMYILPANRDPYYGTTDNNIICMDLPSYRALPAKPGEYLSWNQEVLHYGARSTPYAPHPRMSIAMEFQRGDVMPFNRPLMPPLANLPFEMRLHLVCKQVLQYKHMYALQPEMEAFCQKVLAS